MSLIFFNSLSDGRDTKWTFSENTGVIVREQFEIKAHANKLLRYIAFVIIYKYIIKIIFRNQSFRDQILRIRKPHELGKVKKIMEVCQ